MSNVILTARGLERLRSRHPWIYRSDVQDMPEVAGFYPVQDHRKRVYGWAAVNANSEISVRMVSYAEQEFTQADLLHRVDAALDYRASLHIDADSYRVLHSEGDGLPALVVDRYADYLVIQSGSAAMEPHIPAIVDRLVKRLGVKGVLARFESKTRNIEGIPQSVHVLYGEVPETIICTEVGIRYQVNPYTGQKTGAFLDQRLNRQRLGEFAKGQALDIFSYQGAFGLHLAGKVDQLECIDVSEVALKQAAENMNLNGFTNVAYVAANAFDYLRELERSGRKFDVISLDPPALAKLKKDLGNAYGAYKELNLRCMKLLTPGGILASSSCSFHVQESDFYVMLNDAARDAGRRMRVIERGSQAPDHPELLGIPETRYLKFAILQAVD